MTTLPSIKHMKAVIAWKIFFIVVICLLIIVQITPVNAAQITIPDGPFQMDCSPADPACDKDEGPAAGIRVQVPAFKIIIHEVTVSQYRACVKDGHCTLPKDFKRNKYCNYAAPGRDNHPVNCLDWQQALDYCQSQGMRLPREAEWEKAVRAGSSSRYPWGQEASCKQAIPDDGKTMGSAGDELDGCGEDRTWPVASRKPNAFGLFDMHGNVGEWTANWYAADAIAAYYAKGKLDEPASGKRRVVRGGSWDEKRNNLRSSFRNVKAAEQGESIYGSIGFRCVSDIQ